MDRFQQILHGYRQSPGTHNWDKVAEHLDSLPLGEKLKDYKAAPPFGLWEAIEKNITGHSVPSKVWYRYAAAAVLFFVLVFIGVRTLNTTKSAPADAVATQPKKTIEAKPLTAPPQVPNNNVAVQAPATATSTLARSHASITANTRQQGENFSRRRRGGNQQGNTAFASVTRLKEKIHVLDYAEAERYMVIESGGNTISRIAKRVYPLINCIDCLSLIQSIRERLSVQTSSTGFAGVVEMLKQLQENQ